MNEYNEKMLRIWEERWQEAARKVRVQFNKDAVRAALSIDSRTADFWPSPRCPIYNTWPSLYQLHGLLPLLTGPRVLLWPEPMNTKIRLDQIPCLKNVELEHKANELVKWWQEPELKNTVVRIKQNKASWRVREVMNRQRKPVCREKQKKGTYRDVEARDQVRGR